MSINQNRNCGCEENETMYYKQMQDTERTVDCDEYKSQYQNYQKRENKNYQFR